MFLIDFLHHQNLQIILMPRTLKDANYSNCFNHDILLGEHGIMDFIQQTNALYHGDIQNLQRVTGIVHKDLHTKKSKDIWVIKGCGLVPFLASIDVIKMFCDYPRWKTNWNILPIRETHFNIFTKALDKCRAFERSEIFDVGVKEEKDVVDITAKSSFNAHRHSQFQRDKDYWLHYAQMGYTHFALLRKAQCHPDFEDHVRSSNLNDIPDTVGYLNPIKTTETPSPYTEESNGSRSSPIFSTESSSSSSGDNSEGRTNHKNSSAINLQSSMDSEKSSSSSSQCNNDSSYSQDDTSEKCHSSSSQYQTTEKCRSSSNDSSSSSESSSSSSESSSSSNECSNNSTNVRHQCNKKKSTNVRHQQEDDNNTEYVAEEVMVRENGHMVQHLDPGGKQVSYYKGELE